MKTLKVNFLLASLLTAILLATFVISCEKENEKLNIIAESSQKKEIDYDKLVEGYISFKNEQQAEEWIAMYKSLESEELIAFYEKASEKVIELSEKEEPNIREKVLLAKENLIDLNNIANAEYNTSLNKLNQESLGKLIEEQWTMKYKAKYEEKFGSNARITCSCNIFDCCLTKDGFSVWTHNSIGRQRMANSSNCSDCDLEVKYPGTKTKVKYANGAGYTYYLYASFIFRHIAGNTRMQIGYGAVNSIFLSSEYLASIAYRLY